MPNCAPEIPKSAVADCSMVRLGTSKVRTNQRSSLLELDQYESESPVQPSVSVSELTVAERWVSIREPIEIDAMIFPQQMPILDYHRDAISPSFCLPWLVRMTYMRHCY